MKRILLVAVLTMGSLTVMLCWQPAVHGADNQQATGRGEQRALLSRNMPDVAIDATKFQFQRETAVLPTNLIRGDMFITEGPIYPGGTLALGSTPFPPTNVPPIGKWVCRGVFQIPTAQIAAGVTPFVYSTQYFLMNDGTSIVTEGPEGGGDFMRAIIGGWNNGTGVSGDNLESPIGTNSTGMFNVRFTFRFRG